MPGFVPRQRKHKARASAHAPGKDSNAEQILPESKADRKQRQQQLRAEKQVQQSPSNLSGQKRKRFEKYLETKLRHEENQDLIKKLSQQTVDTSLLRSSKKLARQGTQKEALIPARAPRVFEDEATFDRHASRESSDVSDDDAFLEDQQGVPAVILPAESIRPKTHHDLPRDLPTMNFGSGLKRPLERDENGNPVIQQRKRLKPSSKSHPIPDAPDSDEWSGFSSDVTSSSGHGSATNNVYSGEGQQSSSDESEEEEEAESEDEDDDEEDDEAEDSEGESESEDGSDSDGKQLAQERVSMFKLWATSQRNEASGYQPVAAPNLTGAPPSQQHRQTKPNEPKNPVLQSQGVPESQRVGRKAFHVPVMRSEEVESVRSHLPVVGKEQEIMETIFSHDCTIVTGATGSGKTTQLPQFLFEAGYGSPDSQTPGMIGVTQPRRVAAVSMAKRVAHELNEHADKVAYQIRFDSTVGSKTAIKFMTDGVLLREVSQNFLLSKYSAIVIDEAHERSVNTDILIGMLSRIVDMRAKLSKESDKHKPLKLIIMSATLRITDFANNSFLFRNGPPPVVEAEGKAHAVTTHFARRTHRDYVEDALHKVGKGHRKLPPGGMLVFLTGQNEISLMEKRLKEMFEPTEDTPRRYKMRTSAAETVIEDEEIELGAKQLRQADEDSDSDVSIQGLADSSDQVGDLDFDVEPEEARSIQKVHVLPLYSQLSSDLQMRVFEPPPEGSRLIVLATNVAETSLTIPGIRYVFDCGRAKEKSYEPSTGVQSFDIDWISKASAEQRRGRAGRTGPGHCYRLYSSAVYENYFAKHALPEIQRIPLESVVLQLKSMGIPNVTQFPFPSPPDREALTKAQRLLEHLAAIKDDKVTELGKQLSYYPISPRLARILIAAQESNCLTHAVAQVAVLSAPDFLLNVHQLGVEDAHDNPAGQEHDSNDSRRKEYNSFHGHAARLDRTSDAIKLLAIFSDYTTDPQSPTLTTYARAKGLAEAQQLRKQLTALVSLHATQPRHAHLQAPTPLPAPSSSQVRTLRELIAAGYIDQVAQRADLSPTPPPTGRNSPYATNVPYVPLFPATSRARSADDERSRFVYIHAGSVLAHTPAAKLPRFVVYSHLSRAAPSTIGSAGTTPRTRMHPLVAVSAEQLLALARGTPLLGAGKPLKLEDLERGTGGVPRRAAWTVAYLRGGAGGQEWPLPPARRVVQRREPRGEWVEEE